MSLRNLCFILTLSSCGQNTNSVESAEPKAVTAGLLIEGAGLALDLIGDRPETPSAVKFSMFPKDVALSEGDWFKKCETFVEKTFLGFKALEADLCVSGYTKLGVLNKQGLTDEAQSSGFYLRDIRVKLEVKKIDPLWDVSGEGVFGDVYFKKLDPIVPAVDIYAEFKIYSLIGLRSTYTRHFRIDGLGTLKTVYY